MFEFVRTHSRWLQLILLLLILPSFVALGVQGYSSFADGQATRVATVDGQNLTQLDWDTAVREQSERLRRENPQIDAKTLESEPLRKQALETLINQRVLDSALRRQHLSPADARVKSFFARSPAMAPVRTPEGAPNKALLAAQGMSTEAFAERLRRDLAVQQVLAPAQMLPTTLVVGAKLAFDAMLQQREVSIRRFDPAAYRDKVQISDEEVASFYSKPETQKRWLRPERAQIEYLVLDAQGLLASVSVAEADLKAYYDQNPKRFGVAEERRASHILIKLAQDAKPEEEQAARAKLDALQIELRKDPKLFAELARKHSQDEGSAANGGDLDFFGREGMVKPFSDAAYALKVGEVSSVVRTEFGLHLIELTGVRGGETRKFEDVRAEIEAEQRNELARKRFQELAEQFSNAVYEQADSLAPVAAKFGLKVQTAEVLREPSGAAGGALSSAKLLEAVFAADSIRSKRNTEAVETLPQQLVSARVLTHMPASAPALETVKDAVREQLTLERAAALAKKAGEQDLAARTKTGAEDSGWEAPQLVSRANPLNLSRAALDKILVADASKLPTTLGVDLGQAGYLVVRLSKVGEPAADIIPPAQAAAQYGQSLSSAESYAYLEALKAGFKAKSLAPASVKP